MPLRINGIPAGDYTVVLNAWVNRDDELTEGGEVGVAGRSRRNGRLPVIVCGFLSFAYDTPETPLSSLHVIFGANGSGKSNLVEAVSVLRAVPRDLPLPIRQGGGVKDWLWRGPGSSGSGFSDGSGAGIPGARIELVFGPQFVFAGYSPTGQPEWSELPPLLLDLKDPRVEMLYGRRSALVTRFLSEEQLKLRQLRVFGRTSRTYNIFGISM